MMRLTPRDPDTRWTRLDNGVRVVTIERPALQTASVSVFVRTGSQHESLRCSGISHVVEHMAFKGTATRNCQRINLDAERLGAEVNAHTDKNHTAFHIDGMARDAGAFVRMLGDIVQHSVFPQAELERERQVILHELVDDEEDALSAAFKLFDKLCYGTHPLARPVIGHRDAIARLQRQDLLDYVRRQYTAGNVVVGAAGGVDHDRIVGAAQAAFGAMAPGSDNRAAAPRYRGGVRAHRIGGSGQTHVVLGYPIPCASERHEPHVVAAALIGEGMSSPLLDRLRERRGLAYHVGCSADVGELAGQFVIEASTAPEHLDDLLVEVRRLLRAHARQVDRVGLQRARNQIVVRSLRDHERASRRLEAAALDLFVHGELRPAAQRLARLRRVTAAQVREAIAHMLASPVTVALAGHVARGAGDRVRQLFAAR